MSDHNQNLPPTGAYGTRTSSLAVVSLVMGIAGYLGVPLIGAIAAIITGNLAKKEIQANPETLTGEEMARWGMILGWVNIGLSVAGACLVMVVIMLYFLAVIGMFALPLLIVPFVNGG